MHSICFSSPLVSPSLTVHELLTQKQNIGIVLCLLLIQILAALWYSISYIPFARKVVIAFARRSVCKPCFDIYDEAKGAQGGGGKSGGSNKGFTFLADDG